MAYVIQSNQFVAKFYNCDYDLLNDNNNLLKCAKQTAINLNIGNINDSFFLYNPGGTTVIVTLSNGELYLNTDTKNKITYINLFTHKKVLNLDTTFKYTSDNLKASNYECIEYRKVHSEDNNLSISNFKKSLTSNSIVLSILGSCGGVAKSVLSILNKACSDVKDPIHEYISSCKLHLIDKKQKNIKYYSDHFPNIIDKIVLHEFNVDSCKIFKKHLKETCSNIVIDVSFADTVNTLKCCDELGVIYINSAFESIEVDNNPKIAGFSLQERYKIFEKNRCNFKNTLAIICSGMNPGVVQWMAIDLMKKYPDKKPKACYIVEDDTSFFEDKKLINKDTIYTTWYPEGFLDEAIYSYPTFMKKHSSLFLYKEVYELEFKVSLGEKIFYGCLMPHEEAITLGKMYDMEVGFIYKINDHTSNIIKDNLKNLDSLWNRKMQVLDPEITPLIGEDTIGIILAFDDKEAYVYNSLNNYETFKKYGTNATYHQVASGIYGALSTVLLDNLPIGIYYVDELLNCTNSKYGEYLSYHLKEFTFGENKTTDGTLLDRMREIKK